MRQIVKQIINGSGRVQVHSKSSLLICECVGGIRFALNYLSLCVCGGVRFALNYFSLWRMRQIIKLDLECTCTLPLPLSSAG